MANRNDIVFYVTEEHAEGQSAVILSLDGTDATLKVLPSDADNTPVFTGVRWVADNDPAPSQLWPYWTSDDPSAH